MKQKQINRMSTPALVARIAALNAPEIAKAPEGASKNWAYNRSKTRLKLKRVLTRAVLSRGNMTDEEVIVIGAIVAADQAFYISHSVMSKVGDFLE